MYAHLSLCGLNVSGLDGAEMVIKSPVQHILGSVAMPGFSLKWGKDDDDPGHKRT